MRFENAFQTAKLLKNRCCYITKNPPNQQQQKNNNKLPN